MAVTMYYDKDADLGYLKGKKVAILGYGSRATLTPEPAGLGWRWWSPSCPATPITSSRATNASSAQRDRGDRPGRPDRHDAAGRGPALRLQELHRPALKPGKTMGFTHGFNIHFGQIVPPEGVDVIMIAPRARGTCSAASTSRAAACPA